MNHYYQNIHGWFDYEEVFKLAIDKAEKGRQSASQMWWQSTVERSGCNYKIVKSFEDFQSALFL